MAETALYRPVLKKAWTITKKFKSLWFFGLFAALLGTGGEYEILGQAISQPGNQAWFFAAYIIKAKNFIFGFLSLGGQNWREIFIVMANNPQTFSFLALICLVALAVTVFFIWLAIISQVGLIKNASAAVKDKPETINDAIDFATGKFWPAVLINLCLKIAIFILFLVLGAVAFTIGRGNLAGHAVYYAAFVVFVFAVFIVSFLVRYQLFFVILKKQKIWPALQSACRLFKQHWLVSLETSFILFTVSLGVIFINTLVISMSLTMPVIVLFYYHWAAWAIGLLSITGFILMLAVNLFLIAVLTTFSWAAWTALFERLNADGGISRIARSSAQIASLIKDVG